MFHPLFPGRPLKMSRTIAIGVQSYETLIRDRRFYIDKTSLIRKFGIAFQGKKALVGN